MFSVPLYVTLHYSLFLYLHLFVAFSFSLSLFPFCTGFVFISLSSTPFDPKPFDLQAVGQLTQHKKRPPVHSNDRATSVSTKQRVGKVFSVEGRETIFSSFCLISVFAPRCLSITCPSFARSRPRGPCHKTFLARAGERTRDRYSVPFIISDTTSEPQRLLFVLQNFSRFKLTNTSSQI